MKEREVKTATLLASLCLLAPINVALAADKSAGSQTVSVAGSQPSARGPAEYFTGNARVDPLFPPKETALFAGEDGRQTSVSKLTSGLQFTRRFPVVVTPRAGACRN